MAALKKATQRGVSPLPSGWIRPLGPCSIPPGEGVSSRLVFLAMPGGEVKFGQCLYRPRGATYSAPVHAWFAIDDVGNVVQLDDDPIAWRPFELPRHPLEA